jgi:glycosyltransferase involved in cell wall biosynthesis
MKILFHHRIGSKDGQFVHLEELTSALTRLGHEVILVGPAVIEQEEFGSDAGVVDILKKWLPRALYELLEFGYALPAFIRLWRAARLHRPDGIYERYNLFFPSGVWVHRLQGLPLLLEVNAPLLQERSSYGGLRLSRLARWSEEYAWRGADYVLPVTQVLADHVRRAGVPVSRIVVVPNGVDRAKFQRQPDRAAAKRALGLEGKLVLGFTGFVREWHRLDRVIDWIADHPGQPPRHLLITGDGPARESLVQRAHDRGLGHAVTITGVVSRDEVFRYVAAYDVALQPAVVEYASPLKLFEYLVLGCAIIAPAMPNIREVLVTEKNSLLFEPSDDVSFNQVLERICSDDALRERISQGARRTIDEGQFTWEHNAERVLGLFRALGATGVSKQVESVPENSTRE